MRSFPVSSKAPGILIVDDISQNVDLARSLMQAAKSESVTHVSGTAVTLDSGPNTSGERVG